MKQIKKPELITTEYYDFFDLKYYLEHKYPQYNWGEAFSELIDSPANGTLMNLYLEDWQNWDEDNSLCEPKETDVLSPWDKRTLETRKTQFEMFKIMTSEFYTDPDYAPEYKIFVSW